MANLLMAFMISFSAGLLAQSDEPYAKGYCFFKSKRIVMERTQAPGPFDGPAWRAKLGNELVAEVSFQPGFSMTFVYLTLKRDQDIQNRSMMWIAGMFGPDDKEPNPKESYFHHFDALTLESVLPEGEVCCEYNFYGERSFSGELTDKCIDPLP